MATVPQAPEPGKCGCPPASWQNMHSLMKHRMSFRSRWDERPLDEVRQTVSQMAHDGTEDNSLCVPWRLTNNPNPFFGEPPQDGKKYPAPFVIVAPSPEEYYQGKTIVYTPSVVSQNASCLVSVLIDIECKFKAMWEMAHLMSLHPPGSPLWEQRQLYSRRLLADLARSRQNPDLTPWAITRPYARPPGAVAKPVPLPTQGPIVYTVPAGLAPEYTAGDYAAEDLSSATPNVQEAFQGVLAGDQNPGLFAQKKDRSLAEERDADGDQAIGDVEIDS